MSRFLRFRLRGLSRKKVLPTFLVFVFLNAGNLAAEEESPRNYVSVYYGLALNASGPIISGANTDLKLMESAVNTGLLVSPGITQAVQAIGPLYHIPGFELSSDQIGVEYARVFYPRWSWSVGFQFMTIRAGVQIPATFVDATKLGYSQPVYTPFSRADYGTIPLASVYELDAGLKYSFFPDSFLDPYIKGTVGGGYGWLGRDTSKFVKEIHAGFSAGAMLKWESLFIFAEGLLTGHIAWTEATPFYDRTKVLVNPHTGSIYIARVQMGGGVRF